MRRLLPLVAVLLTSCMRNQAQSPSWEEEDKSIRFPKFYERFPVMVGKEGELSVMDGETLRAINVAATDFIRPPSKATQCWETREAHRYRVIRRGDIIFVRIDLASDYCEMGFGLLDYGVAYAISTGGRILRRLYDGEPEDWSSPPSTDVGELGPEYAVDPSRLGQTGGPVDCELLRSFARSPRRKSPMKLPEECEVDGGTPPAPSQVDGGTPPPQPDGGTPPLPSSSPLAPIPSPTP